MDPLDVPATPDLLRRAHLGDGDAWRILVSRHGVHLTRVARLRLDPRLAARFDPEDLVQETFADAYTLLDRYFRDSDSVSFPSWLRQRLDAQLARVHRDHVDTQKRTVRRERDTQAGPADPGSAWAGGPADPGTTPSRSLSRREAGQLVRESLARLGEVDREVLTLFFLEDFSRQEVALILGLRPNAVSARLLRATSHLASDLQRAQPDWCHDAHPRTQRTA